MDLGRFGVWARASGLDSGLAAHIEGLGFGAVWVGASPSADLDLPERLLDATNHIVVATGIVNIWSADADTVAESYHRLEAKHPGRFLLGVGVGHRERTGDSYVRPYAAMVDYLDRLDAADVPVGRRILAALGPRVLRLAAERSAGAHPYLTTPEHTTEARRLLGPERLLAPEHKVVLATDPAQARALGRPAVENPYLGLANYTNNLRRHGWNDEDLTGGGSDRLIDALVLHGDSGSIAGGLTAHLDAGADHVCLQLLVEQGADRRAGYTKLATALGLAAR